MCCSGQIQQIYIKGTLLLDDHFKKLKKPNKQLWQKSVLILVFSTTLSPYLSNKGSSYALVIQSKIKVLILVKGRRIILTVVNII